MGRANSPTIREESARVTNAELIEIADCPDGEQGTETRRNQNLAIKTAIKVDPGFFRAVMQKCLDDCFYG